MTYDISEFIPSYPYITDPSFNSSMLSKVEFRDPKIESTEQFPDTKGQLLTHQTIISRLMSSYTPYDGILLMHEMGTGKSCSAAAIIERILEEKNGLKYFYYVAKNKLLLSKFADEFRSKCTRGDYPNKLSSYGIRFMTYDLFLKANSRVVNGVITPIKNRLDNSVVVIDEIHNIREQARTYDSYYKILRASQNTKVVLMSGTPVTDTINEIASVMNLILPLSSQLPTGFEFDSKFIDGGILKNTDILRDAFNGRISYIKNMQSGVKKNYVGIKPSTFKHFVLDDSVMSAEQTAGYIKTIDPVPSSDDNEVVRTSSVAFTTSLGASDFVIDGVSGVGIQTDRFVVKGSTDAEKIQYIKKFSSKYAASVETILKARDDNKSVFVFNSHVRGGGLLMFARILKYFGFGEVNAKNIESVTTVKERFIVLTGETERTEFSTRFNNADNINGEYIRVILASNAISEGYSFENIQVIDIHSPWFNFARISQAIARGIRVGSHRNLKKSRNDDSDVVVDIHLRVSSPKGGGRSIETEVYKRAENKDIMFQQIEHLIKEEAIDASFAYARNKRPDSMDGTRECDYTACKYIPHPRETNKRTVLDFSSYEKFYGDYSKYIDIISSFFKTEYIVPLARIINETKEERPIVSTVAEIIFNEIPIESPSGEKCYLAEENDLLFLTNSRVNHSTLMDSYYTQTSHIISDIVSGEDPIDKDDEFKSTAEDVRALNFELLGFLPEQKQTILEAHINVFSTKTVEEKFAGLYCEIDGVMYNWFLASEVAGSPVRERSMSGEWSDSPESTGIVNQHLEGIKDDVIRKAFEKFGEEGDAYYGFYKYTDEHLAGIDPKITSLLTLKTGVLDARKKSRGRNCVTMTGKAAVVIHEKIISILGVLPPGKIKLKSKCSMIEELFIANGLWYRDVQLI